MAPEPGTPEAVELGRHQAAWRASFNAGYARAVAAGNALKTFIAAFNASLGQALAATRIARSNNRPSYASVAGGTMNGMGDYVFLHVNVPGELAPHVVQELRSGAASSDTALAEIVAALSAMQDGSLTVRLGA